VKIKRVNATLKTLLDPTAAVWNSIASRDFAMAPTPLKGNPAIKRVSPFIEKSTDHGTVTELTASGVHNGEALALRLTWSGGQHAMLIDLDEFVDGVAVMFPLSAKASAVTMGSRGEPVNAWYWKANLKEVGFDVVAEGYGTSVRRKGKESQIRAGASHKDGVWRVVLGRALDIGNDHARFRPGKAARLAFAVWDGGNRERAGRKSFSGDFVVAELDA
jgi:DMSO reductase family type II enzyme heme b subunit